MSIIYNAIQKTQQHRLKQFDDRPSKPWPLKQMGWGLAGLVSVISMILMIASLVHHRPKPVAVPPPAPAVPAKPVARLQSIVDIENFKNHHLVSGIYLSQQERIALINDRFIHPGDKVDGMEVVSIESNRVILRDADNALILPVDQSQAF